jgi:hypothetical protein
MKAVFLDYDTVSTGDLDTAGLKRLMPELQLCGSTDESEISGRLADAEIVLLNKSA